jgi:hypothetical protein
VGLGIGDMFVCLVQAASGKVKRRRALTDMLGSSLILIAGESCSSDYPAHIRTLSRLIFACSNRFHIIRQKTASERQEQIGRTRDIS